MHKGKAKLSGVLHKGFKPDKCKTALRMAVARIKLLRNRKEVQVRQMRRELAQLLEADQDQTARIRVEHVIREEKMMAAYDLMAVYCELIVARMTIIESQKNCPIDLKEAIASVIFASMRCSDIIELVDVRKQFSTKYGKEFAAAALEVRPDSGVNRLVIEKLSAGAPDVQTKIKTLSSIADEHSIKWEPKAFEEKLQKQNEDLLYGSTAYSGANIPTMGSSTASMSTPQPTYSSASTTTVESSTSHIPPAPSSYSSAYNPSNSNAFSHENRRFTGASVPPSSHYGATTYPSAEIPGFNHFSQENAGGPGVSRPHSQSQYAATISDSVSSEEEVSQRRERKSSVDSNWNVEFKDATSAAQAAAESAEMASIAARAAAQLASRGNFSAGPNTGAYGSAAYIHENTPNKQPVEHLVKDEKRSFNKQRSDMNDPRYVETTETNHAGSQNIPTAYSASQFHSYGPKSDDGVYGIPTEQPPSHSSEPPLYDGLDKREGNIRRTEVYQFDLPEERLSDAGLGGCNIKDMQSRQTSFDHKNTNNYYSSFTSSHGAFTHDSSTVWDDHKDKVTGDSSAVVFDQYDSDVEKHPTFGMHHEENLLDSTKYTKEAPTFQEHDRLSPGTDWNQWHQGGSLVNDNTSRLFSRTDTQPSDNLEGSRKDSRSPRSYDNVPPTFDSDGDSSDEEEITTTMQVETLRSHSSGSGFIGEEKEAGANRISEKLDPDGNKSSEEYESRSTKKYQNTSAEEQIVYSGGPPRLDYAGAQGNFGRVQIGDSILPEQETEPHEFKGASSEATEAKENQSFPFSRQNSATSDDKDRGELGLKFGRLTPGLRNKPRQPPSYSKNSEDNVLPKQTLHKTPASIENSVHSYENDTSFGQIGNTPTSYGTTNTSFAEDYNEELYDKRQGVGARGEGRSTMSRNYFDSDDADKLYEQTGNTLTSSRTTKSSFGANSSQELYDKKPAVGVRREARSRITRNYFDSDDSEDECAQQQTVQTKWSREQIQSRRTREVTSDLKRDGHYQTAAQLTDKTESMPQEAKHPTEALPNAGTEERTEAPMYPKVPVQRSSLKPVQIEASLSRGKSQETELNKSFVPETSVETPTEITPKATPSHVHPKLPDYDSFAAHFQSLRTNRR